MQSRQALVSDVEDLSTPFSINTVQTHKSYVSCSDLNQPTFETEESESSDSSEESNEGLLLIREETKQFTYQELDIKQLYAQEQ